MIFERVNVYMKKIKKQYRLLFVELSLVQILVTVAIIQMKLSENRSRERFQENNV